MRLRLLWVLAGSLAAVSSAGAARWTTLYRTVQPPTGPTPIRKTLIQTDRRTRRMRVAERTNEQSGGQEFVVTNSRVDYARTLRVGNRTYLIRFDGSTGAPVLDLLQTRGNRAELKTIPSPGGIYDKEPSPDVAAVQKATLLAAFRHPLGWNPGLELRIVKEGRGVAAFMVRREGRRGRILQARRMTDAYTWAPLERATAADAEADRR